jgi:type 1 glutamine amidotransferase
MKHFPPVFTIHDEIYQAKDFSRDRVRVLMRLDASKLDMTKKGIHRTDEDFAVTWVRDYGKGRMFYCGLGHPPEVWDDLGVQKMWIEAVKWAMGLIPGDATPRKKP